MSVSPARTTERVVRVEPVDSLPVDDGLLLLYEREVIKVATLGQVIFDYCDEPRTASQVAAELARECGEPPDAELEAATRTILDDLLSSGVLRSATAGPVD